jgi:hypothetical protein
MQPQVAAKIALMLTMAAAQQAVLQIQQLTRRRRRAFELF